MGQKVNPHGIRVGVIKDWSSTWYADSEFADNLVEDYNIRKFLKKKLYQAGVSDIKIERAGGKVKVTVFAAKPGLAIGKGGADIDATKAQLQKMTGKSVNVDIKEIKKPDSEAQLVAENIAAQLENRVSFRRAMKSCMGRTMKSGALGIKTSVAGRLGGADMARTETFRPFVQTSITVLQKPTPPMENLVLRFGSTREKSFPPRKIRKGEKNNVNA